jgi:hypothetical protein
MPAASNVAARPQLPFARVGAAMTSRPLLTSLLVTALLTALRLIDTVDSDVAWQLWIAERMHAGAHLYRDIIEVNPPLWFWMAVPVERAASVLGLPIVFVLVAEMGLLVALALAATNRLIDSLSPERRTALLVFGAATLAAMPWTHTGQREQIVLIGTLPYAALIAARAESRRVSTLLAILVGAGAALGFALKQYFLIVPVLLELWLIVGLGRRYRPIRPETVAIVAVGAAYAAAIFLFAPAWLTNIVPLIRLAYGATGAPELHFLFGPFAFLALLILSFCSICFKRLPSTPFAAALLVSAFGFAAAYFIQAKGWPYHAVPMLGSGSICLALLLGEKDALPRTLKLISPALLAMPLFLAADDELYPALPGPELTSAVQGLEAGDTVGFITTEPALPWSITLQRRYRYPSRYMGYWMMNAIIQNEYWGSPNGRLTSLGRQIVARTVDDFRCTPPKRIIVWRPLPGDPGFDILPFFMRDPDFVELMSHYREIGRTNLETFEQISPLLTPHSPCRHGI